MWTPASLSTTEPHHTSRTSTTTSPGNASHDRHSHRHVCIAPGQLSTAFNTLPTSCSMWTFLLSPHLLFSGRSHWTRARVLAVGRGLDGPYATVYAVQMCVCAEKQRNKEEFDGISLLWSISPDFCVASVLIRCECGSVVSNSRVSSRCRGDSRDTNMHKLVLHQDRDACATNATVHHQMSLQERHTMYSRSTIYNHKRPYPSN